MIILKDVCKQFGEHIIFKNLNMEIEDGEFIALIGASGSGKTTLLNMIGAIEPVTSGEIIVDGRNIQKRSNQREYYHDKVGFLFQNFALVENKTVAENMNIVKKNTRSNISIHQALEYVGMSEKLNQKVYTLSGGEQQRIALARLMVKKCDIVLADEPTGSLDRKNAKVVLDLLKKINEMGKTIVIVTHDLDIAKKCNKIAEISDGSCSMLSE